MGDLGFTRQKDPVTGRFLPGNKPTHKHGVNVFLQTGKLPSVRGKRLLNKYLRLLEKDLSDALGGDPTPQQEVLVRQVLRAEGVLRLIEIWLQKVPAISSKGWKRGSLELQPVLAQSYGFFLNVQRQAILALGLDRKPLPEQDLAQIVAEIDREAAKKAEREAAGQGKGADQGERTQLGPNDGDISSQKGEGEDHD
ncbi:MAG: hypothetical protein WBC70_01295 [Candidatus Aminicenantales bacterium]